jgi:hypothetical protein
MLSAFSPPPRFDLVISAKRRDAEHESWRRFSTAKPLFLNLTGVAVENRRHILPISLIRKTQLQ